MLLPTRFVCLLLLKVVRLCAAARITNPRDLNLNLAIKVFIKRSKTLICIIDKIEYFCGVLGCILDALKGK